MDGKDRMGLWGGIECTWYRRGSLSDGRGFDQKQLIFVPELEDMV